MAISKGRSSKRTASSSYSSTVTTLVFITLCILGIWMLTSSNSSPTPSQKAVGSKARVDTEAVENVSDDPPPSDDKGTLSEPREMEQEMDGTNQDTGTQVLEETTTEDVGMKSDNQQASSHATSEMQDEHDEQPVSESLPTDETPTQETQQTSENADDAATNESSSQSDTSTEKQESEQATEETATTEQTENQETEQTTEDTSTARSENHQPETQESETNPEDTSFAKTGRQESEQNPEDVSANQKVNQESEQNAEETSNQSENQDPCLDNEKAIKQLRSRAHFEHRERHCPEEPPTCLVPLPAISAVMGSQRLPFPSRVFDLVHCARCRVPVSLQTWNVQVAASFWN